MKPRDRLSRVGIKRGDRGERGDSDTMSSVELSAAAVLMSLQERLLQAVAKLTNP